MEVAITGVAGVNATGYLANVAGVTIPFWFLIT